MDTGNDPLPKDKRSLTTQLKEKSRRRREGLERLPAPTRAPRNDPLPNLDFVHVPIEDLRVPPRAVRTLDPPHVREVANVWTYPGASSLGSDARRGLHDHPTVKPTAILEDALLDLSNRGDTVIDPFLGSGSTLMAAHRSGRVCRGVELDPLYVDVIVRRYQAAAGNQAVLLETSETFEALAARRAREEAPA